MIVPKKLLPSQGPVTYTFRFLSLKPPPPHTPFHICLVDKDEIAVLYRLHYDGTKESYQVQGPELQVQGIFLGPASDSWKLEEAFVSYNEETLSFPYYGTVGEKSKDGAAYIPVSYKPDVDMKPIYDAEYLLLKEKILQFTVELTLAGSLATGFLTTMDKGYAFGIGGSIGYMYISLLEMGIDRIGNKQGAFLEQIVRLGIIFAMSASIIHKYHEPIEKDSMYFFFGILGFMMNRIALILSYITKEDKSNGSIT